MAGSFETVVAPEQQEQPRAWLSFKRASVYKQNDGVVVVIDCTPAVLRNRELQGAFAGRALDDNDKRFYTKLVCMSTRFTSNSKVESQLRGPDS